MFQNLKKEFQRRRFKGQHSNLQFGGYLVDKGKLVLLYWGHLTRYGVQRYYLNFIHKSK